MKPVVGFARSVARSHAAWVVLLVLALLGAGEAGARALFDAPRPSFVQHPLLGTIRPAGFRMTKVSFDAGEFVYETNELGLRAKSLHTVEKPAGTFRILFVGGSTTENGDLPEEQTFPGIVEARLNERFHGSPRVEVGNAGVPGGTSATSLAAVAHRLLELKPDLVCELDGLNDLVDSLRDDWDPLLSHLAQTGRPRFKDWLVGESRLFAVLDARARYAFERDARLMFEKKRALRRRRPIREPGFDLTRGLARFAENQRRLAALCREAHVASGFLTQPTLLKAGLTPEEDARLWNTQIPGSDWNLRPPTLLAALESYNESVRATARETGSLLVDAATLVPRDALHFMDDAHLAPEGNVAVADAVVATVLSGTSLGSPR